MSGNLTPKEIELETERLNIERERLAIEKTKAEREQRFLNRNLGTIVTAIVSVAAVLVSAGQVWITYIAKNKELAISTELKNKELEVLNAQKFKEFEILGIKQDREYSISLGNFVMSNAEAIFGRNEEKRSLVKSILLSTYAPVDQQRVVTLVDSFVVVSTGEARNSWSETRRALTGSTTSVPVTRPQSSDQVTASPQQQHRAALAIAVALDSLTERVAIESVNPLKVSPPDLFNTSFERLGISSETLLAGFRSFLATSLPEIKTEIGRMPLAPGMKVNDAKKYIETSLQAH